MLKQQEVRNTAKKYHIKASGLSGTELIRKIQRAEGNFDCFATASNSECDQFDCRWRNDCFAASVH